MTILKIQNENGEWIGVPTIQGSPGKDGVTPTLKVGTTTTGEAGTNANVTMNQNGTEYTLNFTIPKGKDGTGGSGGDVDLSDYVKKTDYATSSKAGLVRPANGLFMSGTTGAVLISKASEAQIDAKTDKYYPIVPYNLDYAVKSVGDGYYAKNDEIPTKTSQLTNDSGFLTSHQSLANYYTKAEVEALFNSITNGNEVSY